MNDISDLDEFDPERKRPPLRLTVHPNNNSIDDLAEFEPKETPEEPEKKKEWWQGFNDDPSWQGLAARLGIGAVRGAKDVGDTVAHGIGNVAASAAEKFLPESVSKPIRQSIESSKAADKAARDAFEAEYPSSGEYLPTSTDVGRMGGQALATLPFMPAKAGAIADAVMGAAPKAAGVAAPLLNRLGAAAVKGAGGGATLGATTASTNDQSLGENIAGGAVSGAVAGPLLTGVAAATKGAGRALLGSISASDAALAQRAEQLGIDLKGSQVSNSPLVKKFDQMSGFLPFSGQQGVTEKQAGQVTRAISRTMGEDTPEITPKIVANAKQRIGDTMNNITKNSLNPVDPQFRSELTNIWDNAKYYNQDEQNVIKQHLTDIIHAVNPNGEIPGDVLHKNFTALNTNLTKAINNGTGNVREGTNQIRKSLNSLMERNLSTNDAAAWKNAKAQYKAAKTIEPLVDRSVDGHVSPLKLMQKVINSPGGKEFSGQLGEIADIGAKFFPTSKDSGTPLGNLIYNTMHQLKNPGGAAALYYGTGLATAAKAGIGLAANRLAREAVNSKFVTNSLVNAATGKTNTASVKVAQKLAPYAGLPVINKDQKREPLRLTVNPK
jgi:hypothetical protein